MLRSWIAILLAFVVSVHVARSASAAAPEAWPDDGQHTPGALGDHDWQDMPPREHPFESYDAADEWHGESADTFPNRRLLHWLPLRHSSVHGRHIDRGHPLVGTSWRNRPYYVGGNLGMLWITEPPISHVSRDIDLFGGIFAGCDWDHYWGTELAIHRATPELINRHAPNATRGDRLMLWTASLMYYPWGDALWRPYWRVGVGATEIDFPDDDGHRRDEALWTIPVGVGLKYPVRPWLAARAELADHIGLGNNGVATQHNLSFTLGLECRFGAHPTSYWPWNPSRYIW